MKDFKSDLEYMRLYLSNIDKTAEPLRYRLVRRLLKIAEHARKEYLPEHKQSGYCWHALELYLLDVINDDFFDCFFYCVAPVHYYLSSPAKEE